MNPYIGFNDKADIANQFEIDEKLLDNINILIAEYTTPSYEGYAFILFEQDGKLFEVNGSHCSCHGLEGQWDPEETSWEVIALATRAEKGKFNRKSYYDFSDKFYTAIEALVNQHIPLES